MRNPKFYECTGCGRRVELAETVKLEDWDFGVDFDAVEPDNDGGVRGVCKKCQLGDQSALR